MRAVFLCVIFLSAVGVLTQTNVENGMSEVSNPAEPLYEVANAVNSFGAKLLVEYRSLSPNSSVVFSPLSIASAFFYLHRGAGGNTRQELELLFGFGTSEVDQGLIAKQNEFTEDYSAALANRIYVDRSVAIRNSYVDTIGAENIQTTDFFNAAGAARTSINEWVEERTSGFIPELIQEGILTADTLLVIVNALYFQGSWERVFPIEDTTDGIFNGIHGEEEVPFMTLKDVTLTYKEIDALDGIMVALPYREDGFSMYIFLPNNEDGWKEAETEMQSYAGSIFDIGYERQQVDVFRMPKWEMEVSLDGLDNMLINLGIRTTFSDDANFRNMASTPLSISEVIHTAKIVVDEEGTEAAAATAIISARSAVQFPTINITIDHPFLYFIVSRSDRTVLFQGTQTSIQRT